MACEQCVMDVFGVKVNRAFFAFFICAVMTIGNLVLLYPAILAQKVSMEECNEKITNFTETHACYDREPFKGVWWNGTIQ